MSSPAILASGVVLLRGTLRGGGPEVLLVHRPRYDDWSIPKGKDDPGESPEEAALRELYEETGYHATLGARLEDQHYEVRGRPKVVRYFLARATAFDGLPKQDEVDEIEWVALETALKKLTYPRDRQLLTDDRVEDAMRRGTVHLIRHAHAGSRSKWDDDDRLRPLSKRGWQQADVIAARVASTGIDVIHSSPYRRCVQTVEPLATATGLEVYESADLAEGADAGETIELITSASGVHVVLCSHGDLIPDVVRILRERGTPLAVNGNKLKFAKGSVWEVTVENGEAIAATYSPAPD